MISIPLSIRPGETADVELPFSEVCMSMRVAGKVMPVRLVATENPHAGEPLPGGRVQPSYFYSAQILNADGSNFSAPVTTGEAGIFRRESFPGTPLPGEQHPFFYHYS